MYSFIKKTTDGKEVNVSVTPKHPKLSTLIQGRSYTHEGLFQLAADGKLDDKLKSTNQGLEGISQEEAQAMIQDMAACESPYVEVEILADKTAALKKEEK